MHVATGASSRMYSKLAALNVTPHMNLARTAHSDVFHLDVARLAVNAVGNVFVLVVISCEFVMALAGHAASGSETRDA